jgi:hypothetical protein
LHRERNRSCRDRFAESMHARIARRVAASPALSLGAQFARAPAPPSAWGGEDLQRPTDSSRQPAAKARSVATRHDGKRRASRARPRCPTQRLRRQNVQQDRDEMAAATGCGDLASRVPSPHTTIGAEAQCVGRCVARPNGVTWK